MNCEVCSKCNGKKYVIPDSQYNTRYIKVNIGGFSFHKHACPKCNGIGEINWIDNLFESEGEKYRKTKSIHTYGLWWDTFYTRNHKKNWKHWSDKSRK